jgi:hypothetical protein
MKNSSSFIKHFIIFAMALYYSFLFGSGTEGGGRNHQSRKEEFLVSNNLRLFSLAHYMRHGQNVWWQIISAAIHIDGKKRTGGKT